MGPWAGAGLVFQSSGDFTASGNAYPAKSYFGLDIGGGAQFLLTSERRLILGPRFVIPITDEHALASGDKITRFIALSNVGYAIEPGVFDLIAHGGVTSIYGNSAFVTRLAWTFGASGIYHFSPFESHTWGHAIEASVLYTQNSNDDFYGIGNAFCTAFGGTSGSCDAAIVPAQVQITVGYRLEFLL